MLVGVWVMYVIGIHGFHYIYFNIIKYSNIVLWFIVGNVVIINSVKVNIVFEKVH